VRHVFAVFLAYLLFICAGQSATGWTERIGAPHAETGSS
jgi:hypothetical protein